MRLTYIYHSGFAIEADGFAILIDSKTAMIDISQSHSYFFLSLL